MKRYIAYFVALSMMVSLALSLSLSTAAQSRKDAELQSFAEELVNEQYGDMALSEEQRLQLVADTCEKYDTDEASAFFVPVAESDNSPDIYEIYLGKVNYIVDLINGLGGNANTDSLAYNYVFLEEHYQEVAEIENVDLAMVDWYMEKAKYTLISQDFPDSAVRPGARASYDREAAVAYAKKYAYDYNPDYPDWSSLGGDCANFGSQCVREGGKVYNVSEANANNTTAQNSSNWFSYGTALDGSKVSASHRTADGFKTYWQKNVSYKKFTKVDGNSYVYGYKGDAVSILVSDGSALHTMIIIGYDQKNQDFIMAAHSGDTDYFMLSDCLYGYGFVIFQM